MTKWCRRGPHFLRAHAPNGAILALPWFPTHFDVPLADNFRQKQSTNADTHTDRTLSQLALIDLAPDADFADIS
jgi:hypothetical protein